MHAGTHQVRIDEAGVGRAGDDQALRLELDALAAWVAARLDSRDDAAAWAVTVALETAAGEPAADTLPPAGPVIGRRFARVHRVLLDLASVDGGAGTLDAVLLVAGPVLRLVGARPGIPWGLKIVG